MKSFHPKTLVFIFIVLLDTCLCLDLKAQSSTIAPNHQSMVKSETAAFLPLRISQEGQVVSISWDVVVDQNFRNPTYLVERSDDKGKTYAPLKFVHWGQLEDSTDKRLVFVDTVPRIKRWYFYRVQSLPQSADLQASVGMSGTRVNRAVVEPAQISRIWNIYRNQYEIQWEFPFTDEDKICGFHIHRAEKQSGQFAKISGMVYRGMRYFTDKNPVSGITLYKVIALDKLGVAVDSEVMVLNPDASEPLISMH